jgi:hypothetical protein
LPLSAPASALRERVLEAAAAVKPAPMAAPPSTVPAPVAAPMVASPSVAGPPAAAPPVAAPPPLRAVTPYRPGVAQRPAFTTPPGIWAAVTGVFAFIALLACVVAWHSVGEVKRLNSDIESGTGVIAGLNQQLQDSKVWGELYTLPETRTATLVSTARSETILRARAIYDARSQRALLVFNGLRAPRGKVYQLWAIEGPRLTSLGVIKTDDEGQAIVHVEDAGDPNRLTDFGVSLENAGGSPNPSAPGGPLVMVGKIEG